MVTLLVIANGIIFLADQVFQGRTEVGLPVHWLSNSGAVSPSSLLHPWEWWKFVSAGFLHEPATPGHIMYNMLGLWFFGRDVEDHYGRREFLWLYLFLIVVPLLVWAAVELATGQPDATTIGASGAVTGVLILFALNFPKRQILLFLVLPMPAWLVALLFVACDLAGMVQPTARVNYLAHLAGGGLAFLYWWRGWRLTNIEDWLRARLPTRSIPKPKVYQPDEPRSDLARRADEILAKIAATGQQSLTAEERQTLEEYSRRLQRRR